MASKVRQITIPVAFRTNTKALDDATSKFAMFGKGIGALSAAAVASIAAIGTAAVRTSNELQQTFSRIQGLVGVTGAELDQLREAAIRLGPAFGKSANEAAEALYFITSSGVEAADAGAVLEASLRGAAVGLGDTQMIADLATSAMNAYKQSGLGAAEAVDILAEAVRLGKSEPADMAQAMGQILPIASEMKVGFDEVSAAVAALSLTGLNADEAVTQLKGVMASILNPTKEAKDQLGEFGISAEELRAKLADEGLLTTLQFLRETFDGNDEAIGNVFGNVRALQGVLALTGENAQTTSDIFAQMTDGVGIMGEAMAATADTAQFKFNKAMETARASMIPVGDMLLNIGASALDSLMPTIEMLGPVLESTFANLEEPLGELAAVLPDLLSGLLPVLPLFGQIAAIFTDLVVALLPPAIALLDLLVPIFQMLFDTVGVFLADVLSLLAPMFTDIVETLTPLVTGLLPIFQSIWEALAPIVLEFIDAFLPILVELLPLLTMTLEYLVLPILQVLAEMLSVVLPAAFQMFQNMGLLPNIEAMRGWAEGIQGFVHGVRVFIAESMNSVITALETATNQAIKMLNNLIAAAQKLPGAAGALFAGIKPIADVKFTRVAIPAAPAGFGRTDLIGAGTNTGIFGTGIFQRGSQTGVFGDQRQNMGMGANTGVFGATSSIGSYVNQIGERVYYNVPAFAEGGIVTGPTLGLVGEAGPEAIIPLSKSKGMGSTYNITINAGVGTDPVRVGEYVVSAIKRYERASGQVFASA